jgi:signal transduction histidine kinase
MTLVWATTAIAGSVRGSKTTLQSYRKKSMKLRPWAIPVLSFVVLLCLVGGNGYWVMRRARAIHDEMIVAHQSYLRADLLLKRLTKEMYVGELVVRDYLLDTSLDNSLSYQQQMSALLDSIRSDLHGLEPELDEKETLELDRLKAEVETYWQSLSTIFHWTVEEKAKLGQQFLQHDVVPGRSKVISLADRLANLNQADLNKDQQRLEASQNSFQRFLAGGLLLTMILGVIVAMLGTQGFVSMDRRKELHRRQLERAESALRQLSRRLVGAQEAERKFISRELHDAVGQALTAVGLELGSLESVRETPAEFAKRISEVKRLNSESLGVIRDLAMGLRPSMLDDIGLRPALEWQGRQISRSSSIPVSMEFSGETNDLPEAERTCIYRAVQEALTNCVRHSHARSIRVTVDTKPGLLVATVEDDGIGFNNVDRPRKGIGLLGIQERVAELGGSAKIVTGEGKGTKLTLQIPIPHGNLQ